jgi:hypothetical protein
MFPYNPSCRDTLPKHAGNMLGEGRASATLSRAILRVNR